MDYFETGVRIVGKDTVGDYVIFTTFVGTASNIFDTYVTDIINLCDIDHAQYSTWEDAEEGHQSFVTKYRTQSLVSSSVE